LSCRSIDCRPALSGQRIPAAAVQGACRRRRRVAGLRAGRGRPGTRARGHGGPATCRAAATCVHDRSLDERPDDSRGRSNAPGCGRPWGAVHSTRAGRTLVAAKKILLRDHAPTQLQECPGDGVKRSDVHGAHVPRRHAGLWPPRRDVVGPDAWRPASGEPRAGIGDPDSNAGSNAAAGSGGHSLCAGRSAAAVVADSYNGGRLPYHDGSPRECVLPRVSPGGTRYRSPRALINTGRGRSYDSVHFPRLSRQRRKRVEKRGREGDDQAAPDARSPVHTPRAEPDSEGNNLRNA
jgi:hypothetical protein